MSVNHCFGVRSHFSLGESTLSVKKIVALAKERGYESVAITDTMTVSSMIEFTKEAKKQEIKPIIGCRLRVVDDPTLRMSKKAMRVEGIVNREVYPKVFVLNDEGIKDLYELLSAANSEEYFYSVPRIALVDLITVLRRGNLAVSTGDFYSVYHHPDYMDMLNDMISAAGRSHVFSELVPINTPLFDTLNKKAIEAVKELNFCTIMSRPILYAEEIDADAKDVLNTIVQKNKMSDPWRSVPYIRDYYFAAPKPMMVEAVATANRMGAEYKPFWKSAIENMQNLANMCEYQWKKQEVCLPEMDSEPHAELIRLIKQGWNKRIGTSVLGYKPDPADLIKYKERLSYELKTLHDMGFENYFLLVRDLVSWSKNNGIIVGPGRGSVGGSLIAYLLDITDVDPIRFDLIFERFINPERLDLPDVDLDFMSSRRHEVIEYLIGKYGQEYVAGISNYGTMASASALRDTARVHELEAYEYNCSKLVPAIHGKSHALEQAALEVPEIEAFKSKYGKMWNIATSLQGTMRSLGRHAAGIVVAGEPVVNRAVVERRKGEGTVCWDKRTVEDQGLIKMDILGLSTLDVLDIAKRKIEKNHGVVIDYLSLPLDDPKVMESFGKGDTMGIFQFESSGMRNLLKNLAKIEPLTFEDITAATALYRPGPMESGLMDDYVAIKQGLNAVIYEHPNMKNALDATYGVIVYQESVMQLARDLAGFSFAEADILRKAIGKKDADLMKAQKESFVAGAEAGYVEVELEDGSIKKIHRNAKYMCADGKKRTVEEAFSANIDINLNI